jgi:hypothetical protein
MPRLQLLSHLLSIYQLILCVNHADTDSTSAESAGMPLETQYQDSMIPVVHSLNVSSKYWCGRRDLAFESPNLLQASPLLLQNGCTRLRERYLWLVAKRVLDCTRHRRIAPTTVSCRLRRQMRRNRRTPAAVSGNRCRWAADITAWAEKIKKFMDLSTGVYVYFSKFSSRKSVAT